MTPEPNYDATWQALDSALDDLKGVRAVDLSAHQYEDLMNAQDTLQEIQQSLDEEVDAARSEKEEKDDA